MSPLDFLTQLQDFCRDKQIRVPLFVQGDDAFILSLLAALPRVTIVGESPFGDHSTLSWQDARLLLGQETSSLFFDLSEGISISHLAPLCALSGCIRAGEWLILRICAHSSSSKVMQRIMAYANTEQVAKCYQRCEQYPNGIWQMPRVELPSVPPIFSHPAGALDHIYQPTHEQTQAIFAIDKVLTGHRKRPLLLLADRGRGKSTALGMAAIRILLEHKKRLFVTAPSYNNVSALFAQLAAFSKQNSKATITDPLSLTQINKHTFTSAIGGSITFIAPDQLLLEKPACDLLLIDEAAAISMPLLSKILTRYHRAVFASTEHGYEGSGRAFTLRFNRLLTELTPEYKVLRLMQPIRWAKQDPLEQWLFDVFLFKANPTEHTALTTAATAPSFRCLSQNELSQNECLLEQVFALLVTAHYQTTPNDLAYLLDEPQLVIYGAFVGKTLIGVLIAKREGGFDAKTADQIMSGKRRVKGHLMAQSLACHTGIAAILFSHMMRIVRLAVLPHWQGREIGSQLLQYSCQLIKQHAQSPMSIAVSYGADLSLWRFWRKNGFHTLRMGVKKDKASGVHSLQMLKCPSKKPAWFDAVQGLLATNLPWQLGDTFQQVDPKLVVCLLSEVVRSSAFTPSYSNEQQKQVMAFSQGSLGFDLVLGSLMNWFFQLLADNVASDDPCSLLSSNIDEVDALGVIVMKLVQRQSWAEVANKTQLKGRKQIEACLREFVRQHL